MERVYIVFTSDGYHSNICRVFKTKAEAKAYCAAEDDKRLNLDWDVYDIDTFEVKKHQSLKNKRVAQK